MKLSETGQPDNDKVLAKIEKKINKEYTIANKEMEKKLKNYMKKFEAKDKEKKKLVKKGLLDEDEYLKWRQGKIVVGKQWENMCQVLAEDLDNSRIIAQHIVSNDLPTVYANGLNYGTYEIEKTGINTNFTLYNHDAVEILVSENPKLYPDPTMGSETWQKLKSKEVQKWSKAKINSSITQAILQGEAINAVAKRLRKVTDMDYKASIRNARTMVGSAQNAGHQRSYERAEKMGVQLSKVWLATLDMRTRHTHAVMDGEAVAVTEKFSNGLLYPKDPNGAPSEIYNCRCRQIAQVKGFEKTPGSLIEGKQDKLNNMTYDEWKQYHQDVLDGKFKKPAKGSPYELTKGKKWYEISDEMDGKPYWGDFTHELILTGDKKGYDLASDYWKALVDGTEKNKKVEEILQEHYGKQATKKVATKADDVFDSIKGKSGGSIMSELSSKDFDDFLALMDEAAKKGYNHPNPFFDDLKSGKIKSKKTEEILQKHYGKKATKETAKETVEKAKDVFSYEKYKGKALLDIFSDLGDIDYKLANDFQHVMAVEAKKSGKFSFDLWDDIVSGKYKSKDMEELLEKAAKTAEKAKATPKEVPKKIKPTKKNVADFDADAWKKSLRENDMDYWDNECERFELGLTKEERKGIRTYTGSAFDDMNKYLRGISNSTFYDEDIKYATQALEKARLEETTVVRRGSGMRTAKGLFGDDFEQMLIDGEANGWRNCIGAIGKDDAFLSTTPSTSGGFGGKINYYMELPKGTKAAYVDGFSANQGEEELLIQRGSTWQIVGIEQGGRSGTYNIFMKLIKQESFS